VSAYICNQLSSEQIKEPLTFMAEFFERKGREDRRWLILPNLVIQLHDMDRARALYREPGLFTCPTSDRKRLAEMLRCQKMLMPNVSVGCVGWWIWAAALQQRCHYN
jgi:alkanesulfonate monooxygenase SsuD/methylene tetrahydromethanopterin reductase-like flavin-dependent oxidoreductase (luciferase family)